MNLTKIEKVHKDEIKSITSVYEEETGKCQKLVTASMDGFIKMVDSVEGSVKKAFFVCQSGINDATSLNSADSFAVIQYLSLIPTIYYS